MYNIQFFLGFISASSFSLKSSKTETFLSSCCVQFSSGTTVPEGTCNVWKCKYLRRLLQAQRFVYSLLLKKYGIIQKMLINSVRIRNIVDKPSYYTDYRQLESYEDQ